jgi:hypothetical protein
MHQLIKQALASGLSVTITAQSTSQNSGKKPGKRRDGHIITDTAGYTKFHGTAPDGGPVHSWSGKFLGATDKKPAAIKFIDGKGRLQGIRTLQEVREMAVAAAEGLKMFAENGVTDGVGQ